MELKEFYAAHTAGFDTNDDTRYDTRDNTHYDSRYNTRYNTHDDTCYDTRDDTRYDARDDARDDTRYDTHYDTRYNTHDDTIYDTQYNTHDDTRYDTYDTHDDTRDDIHCDGLYGPQAALRARNAPTQKTDENPARFDWGSQPNEDGESAQPRNLHELPLHMGLKRAIRQVQQMRVPVSSRWGSWRARHSKALQHFREGVMLVLTEITLWRKVTQKIGGHFGGGVQSYFLFLRFLVVLNLLSFLLMAAFVVIPSIVFHSISSNSSSIEPLLASINLTGVEVCLQYDQSSDVLTLYFNYFLDLLSGTGFMEYSYLFYGFYDNTRVVSSGFSYNIPLAYLLSAAFYFLFCLACIVLRMGSMARIIVAMGGGPKGGYAMLIFTGWDYGLQEERAIRLKQNNLRYQLQVDLEEERIKLKAASLTLTQMLSLYSFRFFLSLIVLAIIVAAFFGIGYATQFSQSQQVGGFVGLLLEYLPSVIITLSNFIVPLLCDQVARLEKYSPSTTVILALLRAVFFRLVSLGVLLYTLWNQITCSGNSSTQPCVSCGYNYKQYQCWETRVGQEMYKLTLFDFLITIAVLVLVEFPRRIFVDHCSWTLARWVGRQEFVVPANVLALVYAQTVVWAGALFCPLLPLINTLKFIIIFYCKKATLFQNCRPTLRTFRSTSSNFFFFFVLLFGWILASVVLVYSVANMHPSYGCGPFRFSSSMWSTVPASFHDLSNTTQEFLFFIGSQAFCTPLFIISCVLLWYMAALASVHSKTISLLKMQHKMEGRDKQFLVKQIKELNTADARAVQRLQTRAPPGVSVTLWSGPPPGERDTQRSGPPPGERDTQRSGPPPGERDTQWSGPSPGERDNKWSGPSPGERDTQWSGPPPGERDTQWSGPPPGERDTQWRAPPPREWDTQHDGPPPGERDTQWCGPPPGERDTQWSGPPPGEKDTQWHTPPHWESHHNPSFEPDEDLMAQPYTSYPEGFDHRGPHHGGD